MECLGFVWGDPCEVSSYRREDYNVIQPRKGNSAYDVIQGDVNYNRKHQLASAFLNQYARFRHTQGIVLV